MHRPTAFALLIALAALLLVAASHAPCAAQSGVTAVREQLAGQQIREQDRPAVNPNRAAIIGEFVRARKGPSTDSPILFDTLWGTEVEVLGEEKGFCKVRFPDGSVAYIAKQFIERNSKLLDRVPAWSEENYRRAEREFLAAYAAYTAARSAANYEAFKKSYQIYRELAQKSPELKAMKDDAAGTKLIVDKSTFTLTVYRNGKAMRTFPIAYGANPDGRDKQKVGDSRTPEGDFKIISRERRQYVGVATRWLQLSTRWGDIGIHGTPMPMSMGSRASHGCVRMYSQDSLELFQMVRTGTPVSIRPVAAEPANPAAKPVAPPPNPARAQ